MTKLPELEQRFHLCKIICKIVKMQLGNSVCILHSWFIWLVYNLNTKYLNKLVPIFKYSLFELLALTLKEKI